MVRDPDIAPNFARTLRGQYILSKALKEAIEVLKQLKGTEATPSDLADMEYLYENVFSICTYLPPAALKAYGE